MRKFGQHFLKDRNIARKIVEFAGIENEVVLEIGAGKGMLTRELSQQAKKVYALEIDKRLVQVLKTKNLPKVMILEQNFLEADLSRFDNPVIIGNIPYAITTAILELLVEQKDHFQRAVLTIQKEYGERLLARPGTSAYGSITLYVHYYFSVKKGFIIGPRHFSPAPKISSMVIALHPRKPHFILNDEALFFQFIKGIFRYRRKILKNTIKNYLHRLPEGISEELLKRRPEELTIEDFYALYVKTGAC